MYTLHVCITMFSACLGVMSTNVGITPLMHALSASRQATSATFSLSESISLNAPVFCTRTGGSLCKKNVLRAFRAVVKKINVQMSEVGKPEAEDRSREAIPARLRFHDLRHSVASMLLSKGASLRAVSQRLGHSNPAMTLRVYAHCMPNDDAELANGLNRLLA
jgi:integrase